MDFGSKVLTLPLIVEAIEDCFVPVCIYNNVEGVDARLLKRFDEPSWNNPVVRYLDADGKDWIPRKDRQWSAHSLASRMVQALEAAKRPVPSYLSQLAVELDSANHSTATFAMYCFWEGEVRLGRLPGVVNAEAGWLDGKEVVDVTFHSERLDYATLLAHARKSQCAGTVFARDDRQQQIADKSGASVVRSDEGSRDSKDSDRRYHLRRSPLRALPLTPMQATRINTALAEDGRPTEFLSPRQLELWKQIRAVFEKEPDRLDAWMTPGRLAHTAAYQRKLQSTLLGTASR